MTGVDETKNSVLVYGVLFNGKFHPVRLDDEYAALVIMSESHYLVHTERLWHYSLIETDLDVSNVNDYYIEALSDAAHFSIVEITASGAFRIEFSINPTLNGGAKGAQIPSANHKIGGSAVHPNFDVYLGPTLTDAGTFGSQKEYYGSGQVNIVTPGRQNEIEIEPGNSILMRITSTSANLAYTINCDLYTPA